MDGADEECRASVDAKRVEPPLQLVSGRVGEGDAGGAVRALDAGDEIVGEPRGEQLCLPAPRRGEDDAVPLGGERLPLSLVFP